MFEFRINPRLTSEVRSDIKSVSGFLNRAKERATRTTEMIKSRVNSSVKQAFEINLAFDQIPVPAIEFTPETWHERLERLGPEARTRAFEVLKENEKYLNNPAYAPLVAKRVSQASPLLVEKTTLSRDYALFVGESRELLEATALNSPARIVAEMQRQASAFQPFNFEILDVREAADKAA